MRTGTAGIARGRARIRLESLDRSVLDGVPDEEDARGRTDLGVVPWFSDERPLQGLLGLLDWRLDGSLSSLARTGFATGMRGESVLVPAGPGLLVDRLVLVGCGPRTEFDIETATTVGDRAARVASGLRPSGVVFGVPTGTTERDVVDALFMGLLRGLEDAARDQPEAVLTTPTHPWWVVAEDRHIARLRRLLDGPLRAAVETTSSS